MPLAEEYIALCKEKSVRAKENGYKSAEIFPNLAGFARTLNVGVSTLKQIEGTWPEQYGLMLALFEDEALNSDKPAAFINAYMKEHFGFGEKKEGDEVLPLGDLKVVFEHNITEDGR